jgi:hypothetical protein
MEESSTMEMGSSRFQKHCKINDSLSENLSSHRYVEFQNRLSSYDVIGLCVVYSSSIPLYADFEALLTHVYHAPG